MLLSSVRETILPRKLKSFSPELDSQIFIGFEKRSYSIWKYSKRSI